MALDSLRWRVFWKATLPARRIELSIVTESGALKRTVVPSRERNVNRYRVLDAGGDRRRGSARATRRGGAALQGPLSAASVLDLEHYRGEKKRPFGFVSPRSSDKGNLSRLPFPEHRLDRLRIAFITMARQASCESGCSGSRDAVGSPRKKSPTREAGVRQRSSERLCQKLSPSRALHCPCVATGRGPPARLGRHRTRPSREKTAHDFGLGDTKRSPMRGALW